MNQNEVMNERFKKIRKRLGINLAVNWVLPVALVVLLRTIINNDTIVLAIAGAIPVARTIAIWVMRHRIDWIGLFGALGFTAAFVISALSGGSSLPLKLYHPAVTGLIGLSCLLSAATGRPLLLTVLRILKHGDSGQFDKQENNRKFTILTGLVGFILLIDAVIHISMAIMLPTVIFMAVSKVVTWAAVVLIIVSGKWIVRKYN